jgi:hypothetical protein
LGEGGGWAGLEEGLAVGIRGATGEMRGFFPFGKLRVRMTSILSMTNTIIDASIIIGGKGAYV